MKKGWLDTYQQGGEYNPYQKNIDYLNSIPVDPMSVAVRQRQQVPSQHMTSSPLQNMTPDEKKTHEFFVKKMYDQEKEERANREFSKKLAPVSGLAEKLIEAGTLADGELGRLGEKTAAKWLKRYKPTTTLPDIATSSEILYSPEEAKEIEDAYARSKWGYNKRLNRDKMYLSPNEYGKEDIFDVQSIVQPRHISPQGSDLPAIKPTPDDYAGPPGWYQGTGQVENANEYLKNYHVKRPQSILDIGEGKSMGSDNGKFWSAIRNNKYGGYSTEGYRSTSPDKGRPVNVIGSNHISMSGVPHPVYGQDRAGNGALMMPGYDYMFQQAPVTEIPIRQKGGQVRGDIPVMGTQGSSNYDPFTGNIYLNQGDWSDPQVYPHEAYHELQDREGRLSDKSKWSGPLQRPSIVSSDDMKMGFFNRRSSDMGSLNARFIAKRPEFAMVPGQVLNNKFSEQAQYSYPETMEGEATSYAAGLQKKHGGYFDIPTCPGCYQEGGVSKSIVAAQEEPQPWLKGMMKGRIATADAMGNPGAHRMVQNYPMTYTFTGKEGADVPAGSSGTHYMGSYGDFAIPSIQQKGDHLDFVKKPRYTDKEAMRFNTPDEAEYFGEHYKEVAPMMRNWEKKTGGKINKWLDQY